MCPSRTPRIVYWILLVAATSCGSGDNLDCPVMGCGPAAIIETELPVSFEQLQKSSLTVCHNARCLTGSFSSLNAPPGPTTGVAISVASGSGDVNAQALVRANGNGSLWLQVFWPSNIDSLGDGDTYDVTVAESTGQPVVSFNDVATTYDTNYPNGKDCAPACRQVHFDHHTP